MKTGTFTIYSFAGLGLALGEMQGFLLSETVFKAVGLVRGPNDCFDVSMLWSFAIVCLGIAAMGDRVLGVGYRAWPAISALLVETGLVFLCLSGFSSSIQQIAPLVSGVLVGSGIGIAVIGYLAMLVRECDPTVRALGLGTAFLVMFLVCHSLVVLRPEGSIVVAMACPPTLLMLANHGGKTPMASPGSALGTESGILKSHMVTRQGKHSQNLVFWKELAGSLICLLAFAFVFGAIGQVAIDNSQGFAFAGRITSTAYGVAALLFYFTAAMMPRLTSTSGVFKVFFPVMLGALLLLPFLGDESRVIANGFIAGGYFFMSFAIMLMVSNVVSDRNLSGVRVYGTIKALETIVSLAGVLAGGAVAAHSEYGFVQTVVLVFVSVYLLAMVLLLLENRKNRPERAVVMHSTVKNIDDQIKEQCRRCATIYGLTRRENEILFYLAKGRSRVYISEDLVVSQNTVKGHIKNIYAKTGVHTKQELIDLLDAQ